MRKLGSVLQILYSKTYLACRPYDFIISATLLKVLFWSTNSVLILHRCRSHALGGIRGAYTLASLGMTRRRSNQSKKKELRRTWTVHRQEKERSGYINALQRSFPRTNQTKPGMHDDVGDTASRVCMSSANQQNLKLALEKRDPARVPR